MRAIDLSSWQSVLSTLVALALVTLIGLGLRMLVMSKVQQRRERTNRQINERLRVLIAAYKTLGGSFTGDLTVDPVHLRDVRKRLAGDAPAAATATSDGDHAGGRAGEGEGVISAAELNSGSDRSRRMRDAVEAALSDIILLGTEAQVRLAADAAREMIAGRHVHTHALVVSLRDFIRQALDLDPVPTGLEIPPQGPARPGGVGGGGGAGERGKAKERGEGGGRSGGGGNGGTGGAMGVGMGMGGVAGLGLGHGAEPEEPMDDEGGSETGPMKDG